MMRARRRNGFSLLELMLVMGIISLASALVAPELHRILLDTKYERAIAELLALQSEIEQFETQNDYLPPDLLQLGTRMRQDPWGRDYVYWRVADKKGKGKLRRDKGYNPLNLDYVLYSLGPDGV